MVLSRVDIADFYTEKLGFKLGYGGKGVASALLLYSKGNTRWMLGLFQVDSVVHRQPAEYHISFRIHEDDVDGMISYLERQGIEPVHPPRLLQYKDGCTNL